MNRNDYNYRPILNKGGRIYENNRGSGPSRPQGKNNEYRERVTEREIPPRRDDEREAFWNPKDRVKPKDSLTSQENEKAKQSKEIQVAESKPKRNTPPSRANPQKQEPERPANQMDQEVVSQQKEQQPSQTPARVPQEPKKSLIPKSLITCRSTPDYQFQVEMNGHNQEFSLADSLVYLLAETEVFKTLAEDQEVMDLVDGHEVGEPFAEFIKIVRKVINGDSANLAGLKPFLSCKANDFKVDELLSVLTSSLKQSLFKAMEIEPAEDEDLPINILETIISEFAENSLSWEEKTLGALLFNALYKDLELVGYKLVEDENRLEALQSKLEELKEAIQRKKTASCFISTLTRFALGDTLENVTPDDLGDRAVEAFKPLLCKRLKECKASEYTAALGQNHPLKFSTFSRFDLTTNCSIGSISLKMNFITSIATKSMNFFLPNGKKYEIEHQTLLSDLDIPGITDEPEFDSIPLSKPKVLDSVKKLESREAFAVSDYDWIQLNFNSYQKFFTWCTGGEEQQRFAEGQVNFNLLFSYSEKFKDIENCLKIPIFSKTFSNLPVFKSCFMDLYITSNESSTVADLIKFLTERAEVQNLDTKDIVWKNLVFIRLDRKLEVRPKSDREKLRDLVAKVTEKQTPPSEKYAKRTIHFFCKLDGKSVNDSAVQNSEEKKTNETLEEVIKLASKEVIKLEPTTFFDYLYRVSFRKQRANLSGVNFFRNQPFSFYLPAILIVNVGKIANYVIDPSKGINFDMFKSSIAEIGAMLNHKYELRGLICVWSRDPAVHYPIKVDWVSKKATGYLGVKEEFKLSKLQDSKVRYMILQRAELEVA